MAPISPFHQSIRKSRVLSGILLFCLLAGCKGRSPAPKAAGMPLRDGLYLKYSVSLVSEGTNVTDEYQYEFHALDKGRWRVTETSGEYHTGSAQSLVMDSDGTVVQQEDGPAFAKWNLGKKFNSVWLAPDERKSGSVIHPLDDLADFTVGQPTTWEKWQVIPAVYPGDPTVTRYYEGTTGWLVGIQFNKAGDTRVDTLSATNLAIP